MGSALSVNIGWNCSLGETWGGFLWGPSNAMKFGNFTQQWQEKVCGEKPTPKKKWNWEQTRQNWWDFHCLNCNFFTPTILQENLANPTFVGESMVESSRNLIDTVANKSDTKSGLVFVAARRYRIFLQIARGSSIPGMSFSGKCRSIGSPRPYWCGTDPCGSGTECTQTVDGRNPAPVDG